MICEIQPIASCSYLLLFPSPQETTDEWRKAEAETVRAEQAAAKAEVLASKVDTINAQAAEAAKLKCAGYWCCRVCLYLVIFPICSAYLEFEGSWCWFEALMINLIYLAYIYRLF